MIAASSNLPRRGLSGVRCADGVRGGLVAAGALALLVAAVVPCAAEPAQVPPSSSRMLDGVVAVVDGDPITLRELKRYGIEGAPFLPPDVRNDHRALLNSMIEHRLLKFEFEKNGITAPDAMVERYIASVLEDGKQTRAQLDADIARVGLTWKDYFERMRDEVQRIQLVNMQIRSRVNIPEEEVRREWENNPKYRESEKLTVGVIFLPVPLGANPDDARAEAAGVQKEARGNFEAAARKYSKGPAASEGGMLGDFTRGSMAPHFEKAMEGLGEGDVSQPVEGPGGLYIVTIADLKSAGRVPFDDVKKEIGDRLYEQRLSERYQKWATEDLRKDHRVDIMVDELALIAADPKAAAIPAPAATLPVAAADGSLPPEADPKAAETDPKAAETER
jgi:peptidyl-prolyl cis-trans isomerase SurA